MIARWYKYPSAWKGWAVRLAVTEENESLLEVGLEVDVRKFKDGNTNITQVVRLGQILGTQACEAPGTRYFLFEVESDEAQALRLGLKPKKPDAAARKRIAAIMEDAL